MDRTISLDSLKIHFGGLITIYFLLVAGIVRMESMRDGIIHAAHAEERKSVATSKPASQPVIHGKDILMHIPFDDLPEGDIQSRRQELRKQMGHPWIFYSKINYDITSEYPRRKTETKPGKALRISRLSKTCNNYSFLVFEGYAKRYVIVEFDVYLPDDKSPFHLALTYISTFNHSNQGPAVWMLHKPSNKQILKFLPHQADAGVTQTEYPIKTGVWTRYRVMTDTEEKTVSLWAGQLGGKLEPLQKNAKFNIHSPIFCNAIFLRLDSGYSDKYIYLDNIRIYDSDKRMEE